MNDRTTCRIGALALTLLLIGSAGCTGGKEGGADEAEHAESHEDGEEQQTTVVLSEAAFRTAGIEVEEVQTELADATHGVEVPAQVEFDPARVALVSPRTSGRVERLMVVEGQAVRAGQPVALLLSPAFLTAQNDFLQALRRAETLAGTQDEEGARALAAAGRRRLQLLGANPSLITELASSGEPRDLLPVTAPFAGTIIETHALAGAAVEPGSPLFKLADLSVVNIVADVPERSLSLLREGQAVSVRLAADPATPLSGRVERIREVVDPATRTVKAVIRVPNPQRMLRPGMFATVDLRVPLTATSPSSLPAGVMVPASAVVVDGEHRYVFVETGPRTYERRTVDVAPGGVAGGSGGARVFVRGGLAPGERVVTRGAFTLKSELGKRAFGDDD